MHKLSYSKVTRPLITWLVQETERVLGRLGKKKLFKVTKPRDADDFTVIFYGYNAYLALREFEKRLKVAGIEAKLVRTDEDRQAAVSIKHRQGGRLASYTPRPKPQRADGDPGESAQ